MHFVDAPDIVRQGHPPVDLRLLGMMTILANFDPTLVPACFDILAGCVSISGSKALILQGSEELMAISAMCFICMLPHLKTVDPALGVFKDLRWRYTKTFPIETNFEGLLSYHRLCIIHNVFHLSRKKVWLPGMTLQILHRLEIQWEDYKLSSAEHAALVQLARLKYQRLQKVPHWILRFGHHLLFQDPKTPVSVITDWLLIVTMDLGLTVSNTMILDDGYVYP